MNLNTSDHYRCYVIRKKLKVPNHTTTFKCQKLKHFSFNFYKDRLEDLDWRSYYSSTDPDTAWNLLYTMILNVIDEYYPLIVFKNVPARATWLNSDIYECMVRRDDTFAKAKTTNVLKTERKLKK